MPIRPPRRIFRASPRLTLRMPRPSGAAVVVALCVTGVAVAVAGVAPSLFGKPPKTTATIASADVAVIDGETLRVNSVVVHLAGVAAPARGDECQPGLDCGGAASRSLAALVRGRAVRCDLEDTAGRRPVGACFAGSDDLSRGVVASGWARADGPGLRDSERQARDAGLGLWAAR